MKKCVGVLKMFNLIHADFYRNVHGKTYKVCILLTIIWVLLCSYAQTAAINVREVITGTDVAIDYWNSFFNYYPVVFPLMIFCSYFAANDFKQGTIKNYISRGISRKCYFFSKLLIGWFASITFLSVAFITGYFCNKGFFGGGFFSCPVGNVVSYFLCQLLFHCSVATLGIAITFFIRNSTISTIVNLSLVFFGYLCIHGIESILGLGYRISIFWALSNISKTRIEQAPQWIFTAIIVFIGYAIILGIISNISLHKKDIA